jgi:antitoxin component of MazEF toxin-antitoxin module
MSYENIYIAKVFKAGTSLSIAIPVDISRSLGIERGDHVALSVGPNDCVFFRRVSDSEKKDLKPDTTII